LEPAAPAKAPHGGASPIATKDFWLRATFKCNQITNLKEKLENRLKIFSSQREVKCTSYHKLVNKHQIEGL